MRFTLKTIRSQLTAAFLLIIIITIVISTVTEYQTYSRELPALITEIRSTSIAGNLSASYSNNRGWNNLDEEIQRLRELDSLNTNDDANLRIIIRDIEGKTVYNSFAELTSMNSTALIEAQTKTIINQGSEQAAGTVTIYISREYISEYASDYIGDLLKTGIYKSLLTAAAALILSLILSRYITAPIIQLTNAADAITKDEASEPIKFKTVNEIGKLGSSFNKMMASLKTQKELRKQLLSDVSHEINNPLNTIRLEAKGLTDNLVSVEEAGVNIINEVDKLKNIIYDLDWLAETDSGAVALKKENITISRLILEETKRWINKADTKNIEIIIEKTNGTNALVKVDPIRIRTVIGNLVDNAVKYTPAGSKIKAGCRTHAGTIEIYVCDNGPAIPSAERDKIFGRFYRAGTLENSAVYGRGLGLAISKKIVELHGGQLRLESGDETGNCFIFTLPQTLST